ncbi:MAG: anion transporter, partial [Deltaproteobacteria bacterium]|nr:anion transporter [Deltaproteobacteria bacterium]
NIGSAATLIGNPQNILVGQALRLSFGRYLLDAAVPAVAGLAAAWWIVRARVAGRWERTTELRAGAGAPPLHAWRTTKGLLVLGAVTVLFLLAPWPREMVALGGAALLLTSRHVRSRRMLGLVDWQMLVLFCALFVVHGALAASGLERQALDALAGQGVDLSRPAWLFGVTVLLSNVVSNVPAVMLLLPAASHPLAGPVLALASTLAGNLVVVGSIANMIVIDQAARMGVHVGWREHARVGVPTTLATLAIAALWLWLVG